MSTARDGLAGYQTNRGVDSPGNAFTSADATGATNWLTPAPLSTGSSIVVTDFIVSVDTAMRVDILEETTGVLLARGYLPANSGFQQLTPRSKLKLAGGKRPRVLTSVSGNISIQTLYSVEGANAPL